MKRKWIINRRFRIPIYAPWLGKFLLQPRWLKRWYYRKSFQWWGHPSNHHWKCDCLGGGEGYRPNIIERFNALHEGERDLWGGGYYMPCNDEYSTN